MSTFTPLDHGLSDSSVNLEGGPTVLAVWSLIMSRTDQDGVTTLSPKAIYLQWLESREPRALADVEAAWEFLAAPDPRSKNADEEGRRIIPTDDGRWFVVSHAKYRERYQLEKRRRQLAEAKRRQRARESAKGGDADVAEAGHLRKPETGGAGHGSGAQATPPPVEADGGRVERRVRVVGLDGQPKPAFTPSEWYRTPEEWQHDVDALSETEDAIADAHASLGWTPTDRAEIRAACSSYPTRTGRSGVKLNPANMSHERLKLTLRDERAMLTRACEAIGEQQRRGVAGPGHRLRRIAPRRWAASATSTAAARRS